MLFTNIIHWNIEGIKPKFAAGDIQQLMIDNDAGCISLVETKLPFGANFTIKKYKSYLKNVDVAQGENARGGVGLFIKSHISSYQVNLQTRLQAVAASVKIHRRITLCSLYLPPGEVFTKQEIQNLLDQLPKPFIVLGDFNAHHPMWFDSRPTDARGRCIVELIEENDISLLDKDKMTMIWKVDKTFSHVDLTLCSSELVSMFHWDVNEEPLSSDHFPVFLKSETQHNKGGCPRWIPGKADWQAYREEMEVDADTVEFQNIHEFAGYFEGLVKDAANKTVPKTKGTGKRKSPPWWSGKCWIAVKKRRAAFRRYRRVASPRNFSCFSKNRANVKRVVKASKKEAWQEFINGINHKSKGIDVWRRVNMLNNKHRSELVNTLKLSSKQVTISNIPKGCEEQVMKEIQEIGCIQTIKISLRDELIVASIRFESEESIEKMKELDGVILEGHKIRIEVTTVEATEESVLDEPKDIADCLGRRFAYISGDASGDPRFRELRDQVEKDRLDFGTRERAGYNKPFTAQELDSALGHANDSAPGPDEVIYSMLKNLGRNGKELLLKLMNRIYKEGKLPKQWKEAYIIPILKEGKESSSPGSYRPIALTSCISKVLERMVNRRLVWFLETKGFLPRHQCGFRKGRSTIDSLASLVTEAHDAYRR